MDRRQVDDVESHGGSGVQPLPGGIEGARDPVAVLTDVGSLGAREELVPGTVESATSLDPQRGRGGGRSQRARGMDAHRIGEEEGVDDLAQRPRSAIRGETGIGLAQNCDGVGVGSLLGMRDGLFDEGVTFGADQLDVDGSGQLGVGVVVPGAPGVRPALDVHRPVALSVGRDAGLPDVQTPWIDLVHVSDVTITLWIGEDDAGADCVMTLTEDVGRDLELLVDDGVDRQLTSLDLGMHVVDGDAPETTQRWTARGVKVRGGRHEGLVAGGVVSGVTR